MILLILFQRTVKTAETDAEVTTTVKTLISDVCLCLIISQLLSIGERGFCYLKVAKVYV